MSVQENGPHADSCTWNTITGLSGVRGAKAALLLFCAGKLKSDGAAGGWDTKYSGIGHSILYTFYVFSGPIGEDTNNPGNINYAPKFADFLEKEGLGEVTRSPKAENVGFHRGRITQVYIWTPDAKALRAWWDKNGNGGSGR